MLRAWLRWLEGRLSRSRAVRDWRSHRAGRHVHALTVIESLEGRVAPAHLAVFGTDLTIGAVGHHDQSTQGVTSHHAETSEASRRAVRRRADKVARHQRHDVLEPRPRTVLPVRTGTPAAIASTRALFRAGLRAPVTVKSADSKRIAGFRFTRILTDGEGQNVAAPSTRFGGRQDSPGGFRFVAHGPDARRRPRSANVVKLKIAAPTNNPATSDLVVSDLPNATAGMSLNGTLTATDAYGNTVTGFGGNITLTQVDGQPVHMVAQTAFTRGTAIFAVGLDSPCMARLLAGARPVTAGHHFLIIAQAAQLRPFLATGPAGTGPR